MKSLSAEDEKGKQKKTRNSARNKRNRGSTQTSLSDIIEWESNRPTRRTTTVLYDLLPGKNCVAEKNNYIYCKV